MIESFTFTEEANPSVGLKRSAIEKFGITSDVEVTVRDKFGNIKSHSMQHNLRTNGGADFWDTQLFKVGTAGATANYMAITTDATTPAATDTTLASEETTNGLARAQGTDTHTASATSSAIAHTWTYTGATSKAIAKVGLFNASSSGTLVLETLLSSTATVSSSGDTLSITWTVNY